MAQVKISELDTLAQQLQNADYVPMIHNGVTYKFAPFNYLVKNSGDETIAGVKTFSSSPIIPTPTTNMQAAPKQYVDTVPVISGGSASAIQTNLQFRQDTAANWTASNPTLHQGEKGLETDTGKEKTGDGVTAWNSLGYSNDHIFCGTNKIYCKIFSGTTNSSQGGESSILHSLDASKIVSSSCLVYSGGGQVPPRWTVYAGAEYQYNIGASYVYVTNSATNSSLILSCPILIKIEYIL